MGYDIYMPTPSREQKLFTIGIGSDLRVVGYNPENADMDNPRGAIIREVFHIQATNEYGERRVWGSFDSADLAEKSYLHIAPPIAMWSISNPVYGSSAYEEYGAANDMAAEREMAQDEAWGFDTRCARYF